MKKWLENKKDFEEFDVRTLKGNFLQAIVFKAKKIKKGKVCLLFKILSPFRCTIQ